MSKGRDNRGDCQWLKDAHLAREEALTQQKEAILHKKEPDDPPQSVVAASFRI